MTGFNINEFRTHIGSQNEFSMASKFIVEIPIPDALSGSDVAGLAGPGGSTLALSCSLAEMPGVDITPAEFRHYGFIQRIPFHLSFAPITLTFLCTGKMMEKKFFDMWVNKMVQFDSGMVEYPDDTAGGRVYTNIVVRQYDNMGNNTYSVKLIDAMPVSMQGLQLDWANDSIHHLPITFVYKRWTTADIIKEPYYLQNPRSEVVSDPTVVPAQKSNASSPPSTTK